MTCITCGAAMKTTRENMKYDASGLPGVTLVNLTVSRCPSCGEVEYEIPDIDGLHRAMAQDVIRVRAPLSAAEVRFLRKYLGWSGVDFARHMGATPETVSRWESGKLQMSPQADRLIRVMVVTVAPVQDYSLDLLAAIGRTRQTRPRRVTLTRQPDGWTTKAA